MSARGGLRAAVGFSIVFHLLGLAVAWTCIRRGSPLVPLADRIAYLSHDPLDWSLAWGVWMLCALTFVGVFAALAMHVGSSRAWLAVIAAAAAAGIDLLCDTLQIVVLPALAAGGPGVAPVFVAFERAAGAGGLVVANGLYTVAVLIMAVVLRERTPPAARVFAFATVLGGALLVVAGFESDARLAAIATGPTIVAFLGWTIVVARALLRSDA